MKSLILWAGRALLALVAGLALLSYLFLILDRWL